MHILRPPQALPQLIQADHIISTAEAITAELRAVYLGLIRDIKPSEACFENVIQPLIDIENETQGRIGVIAMLRYASPDSKARKASDDACKLFSDYSTEFTASLDFYELVKQVKDRSKSIKGESARYLESVYTDFVRAGHDKLGHGDIKRHLNLVSQIEDIKREFNRNVRDGDVLMSLSLDELDGLSRHQIDRLCENSQNDDHGILSLRLKKSHVAMVMKYAKRPETRERIYTAQINQYHKNIDLFQQIISLRAQHAQVLGYNSHACYRLERRVAKSPEWVFSLLNDMEFALLGKGKQEMEALKSLQMKDIFYLNSQHLSQEPREMAPWDFAYYARVAADKNKVDQTRLSEYFPLQHVVTAMFELFSHCLQLTFIPIPAEELEGSRWHNDVEAWSVWDNRQETKGEFIGYLFTDLLSRPNKYQGSQNVNLQCGYLNKQGNRVYPATILMCCFPRASESRPVLLQHSELVSLFHELGHGIHDIVSRTSYVKFHGHNAPPDFAEAPSVMLENWCWMEDELWRMSRHYTCLSPDYLRTWKGENLGKLPPDEKIPRELIESLVASRNLNRALWYLRQMIFARFDMAVHHTKGHEECEALDLPKFYNDLIERLTFLKDPKVEERAHGYTDFTHITSGYDAGYYSYLSAHVFSAELFESTFVNDPRNQEAWQKYRHAILEPGGSRDGLEMLEDFLGRPPSSQALLSSFRNIR